MNARRGGTETKAMLVLLGLLAIIPFFNPPNTVLNFLVTTLIITLTAQGWNILAGYAGQYSFGHAAFFGVGAYATGVLQVQFGVNAWIACFAAVLLSAVAGWVIGFLSFRAGLKGSYFALVTLAFAEVFRILANAWPLTGGAAGLQIKLQTGFVHFQFQSRAIYYWIALALVAVVLMATGLMERRRIGAYMVAVRENEDAASALGVDTLRVKLAAITVSAAVTGLAGILYAQYFLFLDAGIAFGTHVSVEALVAPIVGGLGTVLGPVVGALALHAVGEVTRMFAGRVPGIDLVIFGVILILTVAFAPRGLMGLLNRFIGGRA
jgi:branched-chain amino acid transport system permease protein